MNGVVRNGSAVLAVVASVSACGRDAWPTAPSVTGGAPLAAPGAAANAIPISLGQAVSRVLDPSDPPCGTQAGTDPPEPCQRFAVVVPISGRLTVRVTSPGPAALTVRVGSMLQWGVNVNAVAAVQGRSTYEIAVALHDGSARQAFELTTALEPQ